MSRKDMTILDSAGTIELAQIDWGAVSVGTASSAIELRVFNSELTDGATGVRLNAGRGDMTISGPAGEDADAALENGSELASESWVEASLDGVAWTPIDEYAAYLDLGNIAAQDYVTAYVRLNIPAGATSIGEVGYNLIVRCI